jgi:hypothetical protein
MRIYVQATASRVCVPTIACFNRRKKTPAIWDRASSWTNYLRQPQEPFQLFMVADCSEMTFQLRYRVITG